VTLDPQIVVEWWTNPAGPGSGPGPQDLIERGHDVLNAGWFPTYYVAGRSSQPDMTWAYEDWDVSAFFGAYHRSRGPREPDFALSPDEPKNLGSELHVWNDDPNAETEAEIAQAIAPRLRVIAQKTWASPPPADDYATFERIARAVGRAPEA
jgi:hexosaminidase